MLFSSLVFPSMFKVLKSCCFISNNPELLGIIRICLDTFKERKREGEGNIRSLVFLNAQHV